VPGTQVLPISARLFDISNLLGSVACPRCQFPVSIPKTSVSYNRCATASFNQSSQAYDRLDLILVESWLPRSCRALLRPRHRLSRPSRGESKRAQTGPRGRGRQSQHRPVFSARDHDHPHKSVSVFQGWCGYLVKCWSVQAAGYPAATGPHASIGCLIFAHAQRGRLNACRIESTTHSTTIKRISFFTGIRPCGGCLACESKKAPCEDTAIKIFRSGE
jgi:hypothetical protein